jgi:hypothetical protein
MDIKPHEPSVAELKSRIHDLETLNGLNNNAALAVAFGLYPSIAKLLGLMLTQHHVTDVIVVKAIPNIKTPMKVLISQLRSRLKPFGISIQSTRLVGYWIDEETKERIRERAFLDPDNKRKPNCPPQEAA